MFEVRPSPTNLSAFSVWPSPRYLRFSFETPPARAPMMDDEKFRSKPRQQIRGQYHQVRIPHPPCADGAKAFSPRSSCQRCLRPPNSFPSCWIRTPLRHRSLRPLTQLPRDGLGPAPSFREKDEFYFCQPGCCAAATRAKANG